VTAAVALINPKEPRNVGGVIRACSCYAVEHLVYTGERMDRKLDALSRIPREERMKGYSDVSWCRDDRPVTRFKKMGLVPICVEVREGSEMLHDFVHPENALYIFGPEDGSVDRSITVLCHKFVAIPSLHCLNLAGAVYTVLYDRYVKLNPEARLDMAVTEERGRFDKLKDIFEGGES
jgi:tRNA(Leu) C34 or U34 (ribose-2'-O)-methylase TrmL